MTIDPQQLLLFCIALGIMVATPGPLVAAMAARGAATGFHSAAPLAYGAAVSEAIYVGVALAGLAALAASYGWALVALKYLGAAWLVWIGIGMWRRASASGEAIPMPPADPWRTFLSGFLINLGNPKVALFYMAVFPGFFDLASLTWIDAAILLIVTTSIGLASDLTYSALAARAGKRMRGGGPGKLANRATGSVMIGAGVAIAAV